MLTHSRSFLLKTALAASLIAAGTVLPAAAEPMTATLSLTADGVVSAVPDMAVVTVGVVSEAAAAGDALTDNNGKMAGLIEALKGAGIAERDIGTSGFSIDPVMVYPPARNDGTQDPPHITGYRVNNLVTVRIRDLAAAGSILDQVVRIGANQVQGITFTVADDTAMKAEARKKAMGEVRGLADLYAEAGGFRIVRILSVSEQGSYTEPLPAMAMARMAADSMGESVPMAAGERDIRVTVSVTWEIAPAN